MSRREQCTLGVSASYLRGIFFGLNVGHLDCQPIRGQYVPEESQPCLYQVDIICRFINVVD